MAYRLWLSFAFLTASIYATLALLEKVVLDQEMSSTFVSMSLTGVPMFLIFIASGVVTDSVVVLSGEPTTTLLGPILLAMGIGAVNIFGSIIYYKGMEEADVSRFIPLINTDVFFVLVLAAIFIGESFAPPVYAGVAIIFAGTLLISLEDITGDIQIVSRQALLFGLSFAFVIALVSLLLKFLMPVMRQYQILFWFGVGGIISICVLAGWKRYRGTLRNDIAGVSLISGTSISLIVGGIVTAMAYFTLTFALQSGPVSIVVAIANLEVLLVFFGVVVLSKVTPEVLQESMQLTTLVQKFTASVLMLTGVIVIQVFS